jgi:hypothetical protein
LKIKMFWPECEFINGEWGNTPIDSFWVECTEEEAKAKVYPYLSAEEKNNMQKNITTIRPGNFSGINTKISIFLFPRICNPLCLFRGFIHIRGNGVLIARLEK